MIKGTYVKRSGPRPVVHRYVTNNHAETQRLIWNHSYPKYRNLSRHTRKMDGLRKARLAHDVLFSKKHDKTAFAAYIPTSMKKHRYSEYSLLHDLTFPIPVSEIESDRAWDVGFDQYSSNRRTVFSLASFSIHTKMNGETFLGGVAHNPYERFLDINLFKCKRLTRHQMRRIVLKKFYANSWTNIVWRNQKQKVHKNARLRLSTSKGIYHYWSRTRV